MEEMNVDSFIQQAPTNIFSYTYKLDNELYSTAIFFEDICSKEKIKNLYWEICSLLDWLSHNITNLSIEIEKKLPLKAKLQIFRQQHLVSFSILYKQSDKIPELSLAFGNDGVYIVTYIKDKRIVSIELNE